MVVMSIETNDVLPPETVQNYSDLTTVDERIFFPMKGPDGGNSANTSEKSFVDNTSAIAEMPPVKAEIDDASIESLLVAPVETIFSTMFSTVLLFSHVSSKAVPRFLKKKLNEWNYVNEFNMKKRAHHFDILSALWFIYPVSFYRTTNPFRLIFISGLQVNF